MQLFQTILQLPDTGLSFFDCVYSKFNDANGIRCGDINTDRESSWLERVWNHTAMNTVAWSACANETAISLGRFLGLYNDYLTDCSCYTSLLCQLFRKDHGSGACVTERSVGLNHGWVCCSGSYAYDCEISKTHTHEDLQTNARSLHNEF